MLTIKYQAAFKKDYKRIVKRGYDTRLLEKVIELLANQKPLPEKNRDHQLTGDYAGCRECHITPDWLLIYSTLEATFQIWQPVTTRLKLAQRCGVTWY